MRTETARSAPHLGAVVLHFGDWEPTVRCVQSVERALARLRRERDLAGFALVIANGPASTPPSTLPRDVVVVFTGDNLGFGAGMNRGVAEAAWRDADAFLLLNNDTVLREDCVVHLMDALEAVRDDAVVSPEIRYLRSPDVIWFSGGTFEPRRCLVRHWGFGQPHDEFVPPDDTPTFATGCAMLMSERTWKRVGPFDDSFFLYWEDAEWSARAVRLGVSLTVARKAVLWHDVGGAPRRGGPIRARYYYYNARNQLLLVRRLELRVGDRVTATAFAIAHVLRLALYLIIRDRHGVGAKAWASAQGFVAGLRLLVCRG